MDGEIQTSRRPKSTPWNNGRITGQKRPLKPKDVWAIRIRLQLKCALNRHPFTRNRKFVDSPLEGSGFEPSVPRKSQRIFAGSAKQGAEHKRELASMIQLTPPRARSRGSGSREYRASRTGQHLGNLCKSHWPVIVI